MTVRTELNRVANASVISYWGQMINRDHLTGIVLWFSGKRHLMSVLALSVVHLMV